MKIIIVPIVAILAITGIEIYALSQGIDGMVLSLSIAVVAGLGGYEAKALRDRNKKIK